MKNKYYGLLLIMATLCMGCGNGDNNGRIEASGTIEAVNVTVSSKTAGEVKQVDTEEGSRVNAGDTLLLIDHEMLDIQLNQAQASKDFSEAQYSLLKSGARSEDIKQAQEGLRQAEVNYQLAEKDRDRMQKLFDSQSVTRKQYEDAMARYEVARAQFNAARENVSKLKNLARPEELKQMEANLKRSEAGVDLLKKNISDSYVLSPISGFVVKKFVEKGETVSPAASLFKISDLSRVDLIIYVSEEELGRVKLGQSADVSVDAFKDKTFKGRVTYISPEAEFTPKNIQTKDERTRLVFAVKISIDNPGFDLKPGMPADAVLY